MKIHNIYDKHDFSLEVTVQTREALSHKLLSEDEQLERAIKGIISEAIFKVMDVLQHERNVRCL